MNKHPFEDLAKTVLVDQYGHVFLSEEQMGRLEVIQAMPSLGRCRNGDLCEIQLGEGDYVLVDEDQMKRLLAEVLNRPAHCPGCICESQGRAVVQVHNPPTGTGHVP